MVFREDYLREQFEKDFLRYVGRPPRPRDCPWDPPGPFADGGEAWTLTRGTGQRQPNDARQREGATTQLCACDPGEEYRKSLPWSYYDEIGDGAEVPSEDIPQCESYLAVRQQKQTEEDPRLQRKLLPHSYHSGVNHWSSGWKVAPWMQAAAINLFGCLSALL